MKLTSSAFSEGERIPSEYTCDGNNLSPPLNWTEVPADTKSLALIVDDPDAPRGLFVHWLVYGISPREHGLAQGEGAEEKRPGGGRQGRNGFGAIAYGGPSPPLGTHRYCFHLYALDEELSGIRSGASRQELEKSMDGHVLAETQLMGRYERKQRYER